MNIDTIVARVRESIAADLKAEAFTWRHAGDSMARTVDRAFRDLADRLAAPSPAPAKEPVGLSIPLLLIEYLNWANSTFPTSTPTSTVAHLRREVAELSEHPGNPEEAADCLMLLLHHAHLAKFDIWAALRDKLEKNRARQWGKPDAEGVVEHVKPSPAKAEAADGQPMQIGPGSDNYGEGYYPPGAKDELDAAKVAERMVPSVIRPGATIYFHRHDSGVMVSGLRGGDSTSDVRIRAAIADALRSFAAAHAGQPRRFPDDKPEEGDTVLWWDEPFELWRGDIYNERRWGEEVTWWMPQPGTPPAPAPGGPRP